VKTLFPVGDLPHRTFHPVDTRDGWHLVTGEQKCRSARSGDVVLRADSALFITGGHRPVRTYTSTGRTVSVHRESGSGRLHKTAFGLTGRIEGGLIEAHWSIRRGPRLRNDGLAGGVLVPGLGTAARPGHRYGLWRREKAAVSGRLPLLLSCQLRWPIGSATWRYPARKVIHLCLKEIVSAYGHSWQLGVLKSRQSRRGVERAGMATLSLAAVAADSSFGGGRKSSSRDHELLRIQVSLWGDVSGERPVTRRAESMTWSRPTRTLTAAFSGAQMSSWNSCPTAQPRR